MAYNFEPIRVQPGQFTQVKPNSVIVEAEQYDSLIIANEARKKLQEEVELLNAHLARANARNAELKKTIGETAHKFSLIEGQAQKDAAILRTIAGLLGGMDGGEKLVPIPEHEAREWKELKRAKAEFKGYVTEGTECSCYERGEDPEPGDDGVCEKCGGIVDAEQWAEAAELEVQERIAISRKKLTEITEKLVDTLLKKNHDYGNTWQDDGLAGLAVRMRDKLGRLRTLSSGEQAFVVDEKIEDTLADLAAYCILGLVYVKERGL